MKKILRIIYSILVLFGFDPLKTISTLRGLPAYIRDYMDFKKNQMKSSHPAQFPFGKPDPYLSDRFADNGATKGHYFHQDLLVARRIHTNNPQHHIDVGSRIDGFVAHVAAYRWITVMDIRPLKTNIPRVIFVQGDLMAPMPDYLTECCDSLSCLHALEHFGLGRYGDQINCDGHILGLNNLHRMLKIGGKLYLSVPIGSQRIEFNAHRVFSIKYLLDCFSKKFKLDHFAFINDSGDFRENVLISDGDIQRNFGCTWGCGIFELTKL